MSDESNNIRLGFSDKSNDPAFAAARKKQGKRSVIAYLIFIPICIIIGFIAAKSTGEQGYLYAGMAVAAISVLIVFFQFVKRNTRKQWDGTVIDKKKRYIQKSDNDGHDDSYTKYTVVFCDDNGKKRKYSESEFHEVYDYLEIGDKVRYHPKFSHHFEKYDKNKDGYLLCHSCGTHNDYANDTCSKCGLPLLK